MLALFERNQPIREDQTMNKEFDVAIVGAGPAGISVAIEAGRNGLRSIVIDKGSLVNTIRRYPTYAVFFSTSELLELGGIPFPSINKQPNRQEALRYFTKVAEHFAIEHSLYNIVHTITKDESGFSIESEKGTIRAKKVVIAIGYFEKFNMLEVEGEDQEHVSHFYTEAFAYTGREVVVVGGSNSAGEAALDLYRNGAKVTLVHRKPELYHKMKYWVRPDLANRIKEGSIKAYFNAVVKAIGSDEIRVEQEGKEFLLKADHVLALTGFHPDVGFLRMAGVTYDEETYVPVFNEESLESNVEGLYLAGTVLTGRFTSKIFIENSRHHGKLIIDHLLKQR